MPGDDIPDAPAPPEECEACEFPQPVGGLVQYAPLRDDGPWLCQLCAGTYLPGVINRPAAYAPGLRETLQANNYAANAILRAVTKEALTDA